MTKLLILATCLCINSAVFATEKPRCKAKYTEVSCEGIEGAKRSHFCTKKEVSEKRKLKICSSEKRKKKAKKKS